MNTAHGFVSAFAPELEAYLAFKQAMGCYGTSRIWYLRRFDTYCRQHDRTVFDRDTVEGWVLEQLGRSGRYRSWMSCLRDFGRWLQTHQNADAYVLSDRWKAGVVPARPYLLGWHRRRAERKPQISGHAVHDPLLGRRVTKNAAGPPCRASRDWPSRTRRQQPAPHPRRRRVLWPLRG
jgi:hypothetical protein